MGPSHFSGISSHESPPGKAKSDGLLGTHAIQGVAGRAEKRGLIV
jgi:hypothetical protein